MLGLGFEVAALGGYESSKICVVLCMFFAASSVSAAYFPIDATKLFYLPPALACKDPNKRHQSKAVLKD